MVYLSLQRQGIFAAIMAVAFASGSLAEDSKNRITEFEVRDGEIELPGITIGGVGDPVAVDPEEFEFSPAEEKLWLTDHLSNIDSKGRLHYRFVRSGSYERGFTDSVYLDIIKLNDDGTRDTDLEFFTGERTMPARPDNLRGITGNPILGIYMQGDVYEMERLTGGSWRHFQRRIKMAFADGARVEDVTINHNGSELEGEKIIVRPYQDDPHRRDFKKFADKYYEFIFSEKIPGNLYQIKTVIPDSTNPEAGEPLIQEKLTFHQADFKS